VYISCYKEELEAVLLALSFRLTETGDLTLKNEAINILT
jgi:hypothetical protein